MKDRQMLQFYRSQSSLGDPATAYAAWTAWCLANDERPGSMPDFIGRLRRTHEQCQRNHRQGGRCPVVRR